MATAVANVKVPPSPAAKKLTELVVKNGGEPPPLLGSSVPVIVMAGNIPGVDQARIDAAIARGVQYLKDQQAADGTWGGGPRVRLGGAGGADAAGMQGPGGAIRTWSTPPTLVRNNIANLDATYELSLAILFLDRLGIPGPHCDSGNGLAVAGRSERRGRLDV